MPRPAVPPPDPALSAGSGIALYVQVAGILRHKIVSGEWPPGHRLDNFDLLAAQYKVARVTIRQAVARLVDEGLLSARRGRGTQVQDRPEAAAPRWSDIVGNLGRSEGTEIKVVRNQRVARVPDEFLLGAAPFDAYVEICAVHAHGGMPFALLRLFVAEEVYERLPRRALANAKVLGLVIAHAPAYAQHLRQRTTVEPADIAVAGSLNYTMGSPIARIQRLLHDAQQRVAYTSTGWYRGDCFESDIALPLASLPNLP